MNTSSNAYIIGFAAAVCMFCAIFVAGSAVGLSEKQAQNKVLDQQKQVLLAAGLLEEGQKTSAAEVAQLFKDNIQAHVVNLEDGTLADDVEPAEFDQQKAVKDPAQSIQAPQNAARVPRLPKQAKVFYVMKDGKVDTLVLPVEGKGLWSTLYGFLALDEDTKTVRGLTFYQHGETPGLGGEVDNPAWKALWPGRLVFDASWTPDISVVKGQAGPVAADPHHVDGLSGATLTSRGVTNLLQLWLGDNGFGPMLARFREERS